MVVVCEYSRAERHCCRPIHSYRFVVGYMLIRIRSVLVIEERSLIVGIIVAVGIIVLIAVGIGRAIVSKLSDLVIGHTACGQLTDQRMLYGCSIDKLLSL